MEASILKQRESLALARRLRTLRPLWLQSDERLAGLVRMGSSEAFETLVRRYDARLLSFCRQTLSVEEDAEDILQEVFLAAYDAMRREDRPLDVRPWLYRIARNRCLNHIRAAAAARAGGGKHDLELDEEIVARRGDGRPSVVDRVVRRQDFRLIMRDVLGLHEAQRTALILREMHGFSYEQVSEAMSTSVPSVKSLLVRARTSLVEAAEARDVSCDDVRLELAQTAEGLSRLGPTARSHIKHCESCSGARKRLRKTSKALAAMAPWWPAMTLKSVLFAKTAPTALGTVTASGAGGTAAAGVQAGAGLSVLAKAAVGLTGVVALTGGVSAIERSVWRDPAGTSTSQPAQQTLPPPSSPRSAASEPGPSTQAPVRGEQGLNEGAPPPSEQGLARDPAGTIPAPAPPATIDSSTPEVLLGVDVTAPSKPLPAAERLPGTLERGRPVPGGSGEQRGRPAPGSPNQTPAEAPPAQEPTPAEPSAPAGALLSPPEINAEGAAGQPAPSDG